MIGDPEILILDEPTSGLDPNQIIEIRELIKTIGKEKTVILCSHILPEVEATCDRVVIVNKGEVVADGTTTDLRKNMGSQQSELKLEFLQGDENEIRSLIQGVSAVQEVTSEANLKFSISYSGAEDLREVIYDLFSNTTNKLISCQQSEKSLEDIFRQLTH